MFDLESLNKACEIVYDAMPATPQYAWPLLAKRLGCEVWLKHENHTPVGAFKIRGGLTYLDKLLATKSVNGLITATRGNHGQSIAFAAKRAKIPLHIVVPQGNSVEKNTAMRALGANVIEQGEDFDQARQFAASLAQQQQLHMVAAFHPALIVGVATYALELMQAVKNLDAIYVGIGMGSGICALIQTRDLLGLKTEIIGVVASEADAMAQSFEQQMIVNTNSANTFADGLACRQPHPDAFAIIQRGASRILRVTEEELAHAIRVLHEDTHNLAEGAGAAGLAGIIQERRKQRGRKVAAIISGGNIDREMYGRIIG